MRILRSALMGLLDVVALFGLLFLLYAAAAYAPEVLIALFAAAAWFFFSWMRHDGSNR